MVKEDPKEPAARLQRTISLAVEKAKGVTALEVLGALEVVKARVLIDCFGIVMDSDLAEHDDDEDNDDPVTS